MVVAMFRTKLLLFVALGLVTTLANDTALLQAFRDRHLKFTAHVYKELLKTNTGNLIICPISIDIILGAVHAGVKGNTAKELINGLKLPKSSDIIQQTFGVLVPTLQGTIHYNSSIANKIYVQDGYKISDAYKSTANKVFQADIENINFKQQKQAVKTVNSWVKKKTYNLIDDVISQDDLDEDTSMLLISTVYFQEAMNTFHRLQTTKRDFYLNENDVVKIDMMQTLDYFLYYESKELDAKFLLLLHFLGPHQATTVFVLPNDKEGLADLETKIDEVLVQLSFSTEKVKVSMPKFKIETTIKFKSILQSFGIVDVFEDEANFDGIEAHQSPLKISNIFQKVVIELNENGTNTDYISSSNFFGGGGSGFTSFTEPKIFQADHPFLFYTEINGSIALLGRLNSFSSENGIIQEDKKTDKKSSSKKKPKEKTEEESVISIVDEYTCPCNLN